MTERQLKDNGFFPAYREGYGMYYMKLEDGIEWVYKEDNDMFRLFGRFKYGEEDV